MPEYELKLSVILRVSAETPTIALARAEQVAELIDERLPIGADVVEKNGVPEVNFVGN